MLQEASNGALWNVLRGRFAAPQPSGTSFEAASRRLRTRSGAKSTRLFRLGAFLCWPSEAFYVESGAFEGGARQRDRPGKIESRDDAVDVMIANHLDGSGRMRCGRRDREAPNRQRGDRARRGIDQDRGLGPGRGK